MTTGETTGTTLRMTVTPDKYTIVTSLDTKTFISRSNTWFWSRKVVATTPGALKKTCKSEKSHA